MPQTGPASEPPALDAYRGRRVLVLGATGFVGRWVARRLRTRGADLHLAVRDPAFATPLFEAYSARGTVHPTDLADEARVRELLRSVRPSIVFNLAGYGVDPRERDEATAFALNRDLVTHLCSALASEPSDRPPRLVHVGSALEYGEAGGSLHEDTPPAPGTLYGRSKLAGTEVLRGARERGEVDGLTARLFMVYGPGEHPNRLLPTLLRAVGSSERIPLTEGTQQRDFTFVDDVAEGLLRLGLVADAAPPVVNLARGELHTVRDFVETTARVAGIAPERLGFGDLPTRAEEMAHEPVDISRLRAATGGWSPRTAIAEGVRTTLEAALPSHRGASGS